MNNSQKHAAYVEGYQSAMADMWRCLDEGGWERVHKWMKDNTLPAKPKPLKWINSGHGHWTGKRTDEQGPVHTAERVNDPEFPTVTDWIWKVNGEFFNAYKTLADVRYYAERYSRAIQLDVAPNDPRTDPTTNPL